jgi:hypothetical protein
MTASIGEPESGGVEAKTGTLEVWRDVTIARIARKNASVSELNLARLGGEFDDAALRLGGGEVRRDLFKSKEFNAAIEAAFDALPDWHQRLTKPAVDQSASGACAVNFLSYDDWTAAWKKYVKEHSKDEPRLALWSPPTDMQNSFGYQRWCKQMGPKVLKEASASWAGPEGVTIVQFSGVTNFDAFVGIPFYGWAPSVPGLDGSQAVLFLTVGPSELSGTRWTLEDVAGHEIGHQLFLPHGKGGGGSDQTLHDQRWAPCLMSYEDDDLRVCGVCVLRLRGWSNSDATRVPVAASETLPTADTSLTKMDR